MRPYGTSAYKMISKVPVWFFASIAGAMAGALAGTAFWSAYTSRKNDIESLKEDLKACTRRIGPQRMNLYYLAFRS